MLLTKEQQESFANEICYICKETFENKYVRG